MRVDAQTRKGQLGHVGFADNDGTGGTQSGHSRRIERCGRVAGQGFGPGQGHFAGNIVQILDGDQHPRQGPGLHAQLMRLIAVARGHSSCLDVKPRVDVSRSGLTGHFQHPVQGGLGGPALGACSGDVFNQWQMACGHIRVGRGGISVNP